MNIGEAASLSGVSSKAIRYYESIDLIRPSGRSENNYRDFSDSDVHRLRFVNRSRSLGFSLAEVGDLLSLYDDPDRTSADVKSITKVAIDRINAKLVELSAMRETLAELSANCHGDDKPECPILNDLAGNMETR